MRRNYSSIVFFLVLPIAVHAALFPPGWVDAVVAIGHNQPNPNGPPTWITEASGVFYGYLVKDDPDERKRMYEVFLITNRHVIENHGTIFVRLNPKKSSDPGQIFELPMHDPRGAPNWFMHKDPSMDIAGARIFWNVLQDRGIEVEFIPNDVNAADTKKMQEVGVSAGDGVFVIGFPMNLAGQQRNYAIVRPGAIARVTDLIQSAATVFLIDSHVFPGNSGGPVFLEPSIVAIDGTKSNNRAYLLGIVRAYIPYTDVAISPQTGHARVTFEENSGLAEVIPVDRINEAIKAWRDAQPASTPTPPLKPAPTKQ